MNMTWRPVPGTPFFRCIQLDQASIECCSIPGEMQVTFCGVPPMDQHFVDAMRGLGDAIRRLMIKDTWDAYGHSMATQWTSWGGRDPRFQDVIRIEAERLDDKILGAYRLDHDLDIPNGDITGFLFSPET